MTQAELNAKVKQLQKLKEISTQLTEVIDGLKDEIKAEMLRRGTDFLNGADWKITWKEHRLRRLDRKRLEEDFGDLSDYEIVTEYKSFYLRKI